MKYLQLAIISLVFLGAAPSLVQAQGAGIEWEILTQEVQKLYRAGKYDRAALLAQKALEVAEQNVGLDHPDVATSLNNLASLYDTQGDYAKAEPLYKRSLAISEKALGPDHPDVATTLENLAGLYRGINQNKEAEPLEQRAAKIRAIKR
jgi:tetratricopeptide (TPR) repeat protein